MAYYPITPVPAPRKKVSDAQIISAYEEFGSVWKAGEYLGIPGQRVHNKLQKLGLNKKINVFSQEEKNFLVQNYQSYADNARLDELAAKMGRTKPFICRQAKYLGLTNKKRKSPQRIREVFSKNQKERILKNGHPRGMKGKKHSLSTIQVISKKSKEAWGKMSEEQLDKHSLRTSLLASIRSNQKLQNRESASWKAGWREIGGKKNYYRSRWEANYARYLQWLKELGEILDWEHEPKTFWFDGIKRGTMSYKPDFLVKEKDGFEKYHEVKGWMDARSKTTINRMRIYHPDVILIVIDEKAYKNLEKKIKRIVPNWDDQQSASYAGGITIE